MDFYLSVVSLSHQPLPEHLTILEGENRNQDVYKVAQWEIEMVNLLGELLRNGGRLGQAMLADSWESLKVW